MAAITNTTNKIFLSGMSSADLITNYGSKVTISSGKGNDTINIVRNYYGSKSADSVSITTGAGNDLTLDNLNFSATYKNSAITFKVGSTASAITLKDFTATTFHINKATYEISGSKLVKK